MFGDYDVDGITATCLLTDFLRGIGADCVVHIPGRLEEGYGLNAGAIRQLHAQGVRLIITVDCGITALEEAELCRELGVTLVITDHHECKEQLPQCAAVVDPHRPDRTYPHTMLSGVGIAFKLAAALSGDQDAVARRYCDLICLGTIADVMTLQGENRRLVVMGLEALRQPQRLGLRALIHACGCDEQEITAGTIGYILAPRVNAAGRMEQAELAVRLFLTQDPQEADRLAETLCRLNRERQTIESEIYSEAVSRLHGAPDGAIVLAGEHWHQGVVGIVASRLSEEFCRPTFLICLDGDRGKASSRSYGGFNLFASLTELSGLLEGYGGHELAAGFTIARKNIDAFRAAMCRCAAAYAASAPVEATLQVDCEIEASLLTEENVRGLSQLEPCGAGCPKPVLSLSGLTVEHAMAVGSGKHLRLRLSRGRDSFQAIFFSSTAQRAAVGRGDLVEIAFTPQINEFRGIRTVQLNLVDIRPDEGFRLRAREQAALYAHHAAGEALCPDDAAAMLPERQDFVDLWRYLSANCVRSSLTEELGCLSRKIARATGRPCEPVRLRVCLDVLAEQRLIVFEQHPKSVHITLCPNGRKVDLTQSGILIHLKEQKAGK